MGLQVSDNSLALDCFPTMPQDYTAPKSRLIIRARVAVKARLRGKPGLQMQLQVPTYLQYKRKLNLLCTLKVFLDRSLSTTPVDFTAALPYLLPLPSQGSLNYFLLANLCRPL